MQTANGISYAARAYAAKAYKNSGEYIINPDNPVQMRLYYPKAEIDALLAAQTGSSIDDLRIGKMANTACPSMEYDHSNAELIQPSSIAIVCHPDYYTVEFSVTSFSSFYLVNAFNVLPVELVEFTAERDGKHSLLQWTTASELNSERFDIEHSTQGIQWRTIDQLSAAGTTEQEQSYRYIHQRPVAGNNFYRLKQVDTDGRFEYSPIRLVHFGEQQNQEVTLYPNPVRDQLFIAGIKDQTPLCIYNVAGNIMDCGVYDASTGIDVQAYASGYYIIDFRSEQGRKGQSFYKQ